VWSVGAGRDVQEHAGADVCVRKLNVEEGPFTRTTVRRFRLKTAPPRPGRVTGAANVIDDRSLYLDTSCFLKLLFPEAEGRRTAELIALERSVAVSTLARLETLVQIQGRVAGRHLTGSLAAQLRKGIEALLETPPFELVPCPAHVVELALEQIRRKPRSRCRTLDRLHLAIIESLGLRRLLTNDDGQARAARGLGFEVTLPR
jgi:predicted nucleic acid-binding protein